MESAPVPTRHPPKPRARNALLKQYYGLKDKASKAPMVTTNLTDEENSRPFDLDSKTFNSSKYFASVLKEKTLQGLVQKDNQLVGEIREINGDMKTLVYENYNKFISATDTIRKMKSNVESMESEMSRLNENIASISSKSKYINKELGPNRQKIQQLSNVHNSLKQLQFIFELPNRLQVCLNKGKYSQAVKYYSKASRLLNHYKHMTAFKGIERDCHCIMEKIKSEIVVNMTSPNASSQKIAEETKLLLLLGEDTHQLWKQYIEIQLATLKKKQTENPNPSDVKKLLEFYITPLENIVHHFETLFLLELDDNTENELNTVTILDTNEKEVARGDLLEAINPYLERIFELASDFIDLPINISLSEPLRQAEYLNELKSTLNDNTTSLASVTDIQERTKVLTSNWESSLINGVLDSAIVGLRERFTSLITSLQENKESTEFDNESIGGFIQDTQTWIINHLINACLLPLKNCLDIDNAHTLTRIQAGTKSVWQKLANKFENMHKASKLDRASVRILMLVGSRLCYDLADNGIFYLYSAFSSEFYKQKTKDIPGYPYEAEANIDPHVIPDMNDIIDTYLKTGQALVNQQMIQEGYCLSSRIQEAYLFTPITSPTIQHISKIWHDIFDRLKYTERLVEAVYPSAQSRNSVENSSTSEYDYGGEPYSSRHVMPSTHSLATVSSISESTSKQHFGGNDMTLNMMNNIDKLFAERVDIYRKVDPTPIGVCTGLVLIILKSFLEVVREIQMDALHYQQIQVDIEYVKRIIWPYAGDEKWAATMLQEILTSIYTRCASPVNVSQEELTQILS